MSTNDTIQNSLHVSIKCRKDALPYRLEIRERQTQLEWFKVAAGYLLSNVGLFALTVLYAIIGNVIQTLFLIKLLVKKFKTIGS